MLSYFFIISQNTEYESRLDYDTYLTPPFYEDERIKKDLQQSFFLKVHLLVGIIVKIIRITFLLKT